MSHIFKRILFLASLFLWVTCAPPGDQGQSSVSTKSGGTTTAPLPPVTSTPPSGGGISQPAPAGVLNRNSEKWITIQGATKEEFFAYDVATANIDGDNYQDLVVTSRTGKVYIFYGQTLKNKMGSPFFSTRTFNGQTISANDADKIITKTPALKYPAVFLTTGRFSDVAKDDVIIYFLDDAGAGTVSLFTAQQLTSSSIKDIPFDDAMYKVSAFSSTSENDGFFGSSMILADVDGNGTNELIVAAPFAKINNVVLQGKIYFYTWDNFKNSSSRALQSNFSGKTLIPDTLNACSPIWECPLLGNNLTNLGSIDGDSIDEIAFQAEKKMESGFKVSNFSTATSISLSGNFTHFFKFNQTTQLPSYVNGAAMRPMAIPDVSGDQLRDVVFGTKIFHSSNRTFQENSPSVSVQLTPMPTPIPASTLNPQPAYFNYIIETAADIDNDSNIDLVIKSPFDRLGSFDYKPPVIIWGLLAQSGVINVNLDSLPSYAKALPMAPNNSAAACSKSSTWYTKILSADVNGNGISDLIFAAPECQAVSNVSNPTASDFGYVRIYWLEP